MCGKLPGVALFAGGAQIGQPQRGSRGRLERLSLPYSLVETSAAAMQTVGTIVLRQLVALAVHAETAIGDAVGIASDRRAEIRHTRQIRIQGVEAQYDVAEMALTIRRPQRHERGSIGHDSS